MVTTRLDASTPDLSEQVELAERLLSEARQAAAWASFGTIGFEAYCALILERERANYLSGG